MWLGARARQASPLQPLPVAAFLQEPTPPYLVTASQTGPWPRQAALVRVDAADFDAVDGPDVATDEKVAGGDELDGAVVRLDGQPILLPGEQHRVVAEIGIDLTVGDDDLVAVSGSQDD